MTTHAGRRLDEVLRLGAGLPTHERWRLLCAATGRSRADLLASPVISPDRVAVYELLVARRQSGVPLQYLEGTVTFGPVELVIDGRALIPRPETEQLWELAMAETNPLPAGAVVVDLCTGSGNLALAIAASCPGSLVFGTDVSAAALSLARENADRNGLAVTFLHGDLFDPLPDSIRGAVDLLVANPPYLAAAELHDLPVEVRDHEPQEALIAGLRGDEVLARIAADAGTWLAPGGVLAVEISEFRGAESIALFDAYRPELRRDLAGKERFIVGRNRSSGG